MIIHAAEQTQFQFAFFLFQVIFLAFLKPFIQFTLFEPLIQLRFILEPLVWFVVLRRIILSPLSESSFLFQPQQQTCCGQAFLSADLPTFSGSRTETSASEPAFRLQTFRRNGHVLADRP